MISKLVSPEKKRINLMKNNGNQIVGDDNACEDKQKVRLVKM